MEQEPLRTIVDGYLDAFVQRDLDACMSFFAEGAQVNFAMGVYKGTAEIQQWHKDRFKADMRVLRVESIDVRSDAATIDLEVTSKLASLWRMKSVMGRVELAFDGDKISQANFGLRTAIPIERW